ncbi:MAG: DUF302 domain-containing protein [Roseobacter sp.]
MRRFTFATVTACLMAALPAHAEMVTQTSPHPVGMTMDRLEAAVENAGATVFARVDHTAGAASIDADLRPTQLLIFGNPKIGTPAMQDAQTAGLDLPLRVLVLEDAQGATQVVYHAPADLAEAHGLPSDAAYLKMMTGALAKLTGAAIAAE